MDLSPVIDVLAADTVTLTRTTSSYNVNGVLVLDTPVTSSITCSIQPAVAGGAGEGRNASEGRNVRRTEQGQRTYGSTIIFSKEELLVAKTPGQISDKITFAGDDYQVIHTENWGSYGYYRSILAKVEV